MTSNIGSRELKDFGRGVGFAQGERASDKDHSKGVIEKALKRAFAPEFLNRIDDVIVFNNLTKEDIFKIIDIELKGLYSRIEAMGYKLEISDEAKNFIAEKGYDLQYGARPIKRAIQKYLEDEMAEVIIQAEVKAGDIIRIELDESKESVKAKIVNQ